MQGKLDLKGFKLERILNRHDDRKSLALLGITISYLYVIDRETSKF